MPLHIIPSKRHVTSNRGVARNFDDFDLLEFQSEPRIPSRICYATDTPVPIYLVPHRGGWRGVERTLLHPVKLVDR